MSDRSAEALIGSGELYTTEELLKLLERSQTDSLFHLKEVQGVETLEPYQEALLRAIEIHERVAVRSCHDMGKTWTMAKAVIWFLTSFPGAKVVTTAPTARQVELLLWSEIRAGVAKAKYRLGGELGVKQWKIAPDWFAIGFTTKKEADLGQGQANSGFQGIHGEWVFIVFDEATGIPPDVWKQLEGLLTSADVKFVAIGNPTTKNSEFAKCFDDPSYKKLHLSCFDSPNLKANGITSLADIEMELQRLLEMGEDRRLSALESYKIVHRKLLTTKWVMAMALKWGVNHPLFVSKALGIFPDEDESCLMPLGVVEEAQRRRKWKPKKTDLFYIGVDVARKGGDKTVITRLREVSLRAIKVLVKRELTEVEGAVIAMVNALPEEERLRGGVITVDATGMGAGVADHLKEYQENDPQWPNIRIQAFICGEKWKLGRDGQDERSIKKRTERFVNKKSEAFVLLAEALKKELELTEDSDLHGELPTIQFTYDSAGRWKIEDKAAYKKRTGRGSPDHGDSLSLANFGRYYSGGAGNFTAEMAKPQGKPLAGRLGGDE